MSLSEAGFRVKESTFGIAAKALAFDLRNGKQKLRTVHYKTVLDACVLAEDDLDAAEDLLTAVEANPNHLDILCSRHHNRLEFAWSYLGASLLSVFENKSEKSVVAAEVLLGHFARVLKNGKVDTQEQMRSSLFCNPGDYGKKKKDEDKRKDITILTGLTGDSKDFDVRRGDLFLFEGRYAITVARAEAKKDKQETSSKRYKRSSEDAISSSDDDDSDSSVSSDDDEDMKARLKDQDTRNYRGALKARFLHSLEEIEVQPSQCEFLLRQATAMKILFLLKMALSSKSREAHAVAGLLLQGEFFPSDSTLDEVFDFVGKKSDAFAGVACGAIAATGNKRLAEELLLRHVVRSGGWIKHAMVRQVLELPNKPPVIGDTFLAPEYITQPVKEKLNGWTVVAKVNGQNEQGRLEYLPQTSSVQLIIRPSNQRVPIKLSQIQKWFIAPGTAEDLAKHGVKVIAAFGRACLAKTNEDQDMPPLLPESPATIEKKKGETSFLSVETSMLTCRDMPSPEGESTWHVPSVSLGKASVPETPSPVAAGRKTVAVAGSSSFSKVEQHKLETISTTINNVESFRNTLDSCKRSISTTSSPTKKSRDATSPPSHLDEIKRTRPVSTQSPLVPDASNRSVGNVLKASSSPPVARQPKSLGTITQPSSSTSSPANSLLNGSATTKKKVTTFIQSLTNYFAPRAPPTPPSTTARAVSSSIPKPQTTSPKLVVDLTADVIDLTGDD